MIRTIGVTAGVFTLRVIGGTAMLMAFFWAFLSYPVTPMNLLVALMFTVSAVAGSEGAVFAVRRVGRAL